jgi:hypothetical protein
MITQYSPTMVPPEILKEICKKIESYFPGKDKQSLSKAISLLGYNNTETLLNDVFGFFESKLILNSFDFESLELDTLKTFDIKGLGYEFAEYADSTRLASMSDEDREFLFDTMSKVARIFLHEIIFPVFESIDPNIKQAFDDLIKENIKQIAIIENFDENEIYEELRLNDFFEKPTVKIDENKKLLKHQKEERYTHYIVCELNDQQINRLIACFYDYGITTMSRNRIIDFFDSEGESIEPLNINPDKLEVFVHLIYLMKSTKIDNNCIISIRKTKAVWQYIQENIMNSKTENLFDQDINKLSSIIKKNEKGKYNSMIEDAKEILKEILKDK